MTKFFQQEDSSGSQKAPCISIRGQIMIVNGEPVCYGKQMLTNHNFFLTDHGIDLPFDSGIDQFDRKYFDFMLISKVISQIECSHPKVALQLLQQLPQLSEKSYINLILKLSLTKLRHLLTDHSFYLFLWKKIMELANHRSIQIQKAIIALECCLSELDQPEKRILYMIEHLQANQPFLSALRITGTQLIQEYVNSNRFLTDLLEKKRGHFDESQQKQSQSGGYYLKNIRDAYYSLMMLPMANNQVYEVLKPKGKRSFFRLFRKQSLKIITIKFDYYFNYHRKNLIEVLALIAVENGNQLWPEIISNKYTIQGKTVGSSDNASGLAEQDSLSSRGEKSICEETDNQSTFVLLMVNNFLEPGQPQWEQSLLILQTIVRFNAAQAHQCLIRIFIQTAKHSLRSAIIDLSLKFLHDLYGKEGSDRKIELFLLQFLSIVNCNIAEDYHQFKDRSPFRAKYKASSLQSARLISYLRIYITIMEIKAIEVLLMLGCGSVLESLLAMTRTAEGITGALRFNLMKKIEMYIIEAELQQQQHFRLAKSLVKVPFREMHQSEPINKKHIQFITLLKQLITK